MIKSLFTNSNIYYNKNNYCHYYNYSIWALLETLYFSKIYIIDSYA